MSCMKKNLISNWRFSTFLCLLASVIQIRMYFPWPRALSIFRKKRAYVWSLYYNVLKKDFNMRVYILWPSTWSHANENEFWIRRVLSTVYRINTVYGTNTHGGVGGVRLILIVNAALYHTGSHKSPQKVYQPRVVWAANVPHVYM